MTERDRERLIKQLLNFHKCSVTEVTTTAQYDDQGQYGVLHEKRSQEELSLRIKKLQESLVLVAVGAGGHALALGAADVAVLGAPRPALALAECCVTHNHPEELKQR